MFGCSQPGLTAVPPASSPRRPCRGGGRRIRNCPPHTLAQLRYPSLEQDIDIRVIQVLLGHAKLETTALYARVATNTIRAVTSPLDRISLLAEEEMRPRA
jgi:hypothetical protein